MHRINSKPGNQRGFSLIEVMVSTLVISVGVMGMAGMQITAKRAGYEAVQRTAASNLAQDMLERIRANPEAVDSYATTGVGGATITTEPTPKCSNDTTDICTGAELAIHDMWDWEQAIDGSAETREVSGTDVAVGGLFNPTGCVTVAGNTVTIAIAWEGYQVLSNPTGNACGAGLGKYGTDDSKRQLLVLSTFITEE